MSFDIFLSHCWKRDSVGRNNHTRARQLCTHIQKFGLSVWFDEENLKYGNIYSAMAKGIDECDVIVVCITREYIHKVNNGLRSIRSVDNCACEWSYAIARRKPIIAVIMEPDMLDTTTWPAGQISMHIASNIYVDASGDDWDEIASKVKQVVMSISPAPSPRLSPRLVLEKQKTSLKLPPIPTPYKIILGDDTPRGGGVFSCVCRSRPWRGDTKSGWGRRRRVMSM